MELARKQPNSDAAAYKQTELGLIPSDWEVKKLGSYVTIRSGESPTKHKFVNVALTSI